jgi:DNA-binding response OmpR family regulator
MTEKKPLGRILLKQQAITPEELDEALSEPGGRLASRLTEQGKITGLAALRALSEQHGIPGIDLDQVCVKLSDLELLPRAIAERHLILPVLSKGDRLFVAMANPREKKVIDELEFVTGKKVYPYVALEKPLRGVVEEVYARKARGDDYYIGPRCPPETLAKLGLERPRTEVPTIEQLSRPPEGGALSDPGPPGVQASEPPPSISAYEAIETEAPPRDTPAEEDFGDLNAELSIVTDIPVQPPSKAPPGAATILVVDDEAEIRRMLDKLLSARGHRVLQAETGHVALRMVKELKPDLIVLDAMLPEVHGFDIARRIKGSRRYGHIPIVMVSAVYRGWHYAEDLRESCGVEAFIEKPFKIQDVVTAVEQALSGKKDERQKADELEAMHQEAEALLHAGVRAYREGRYDEAVAVLRKGVEIDPLAYRLHMHLGLLYGRMGQVFEAISELERAVEINSRHFPAMKNLAVLYQKAGFRNKAAETWHKAARVAPDEETRATVKAQLMNLI